MGRLQTVIEGLPQGVSDSKGLYCGRILKTFGLEVEADCSSYCGFGSVASKGVSFDVV